MIHLIALPTFFYSTGTNVKNAPAAIEVSFEPPERSQVAQIVPQIVQPPDLKASPITPDTTRLSDKNFATDRESVKRGMPSSGGNPAPAPAEKPAAPQKRDPQKTDPIQPAAKPEQAEVTLNEKRVAEKLVNEKNLNSALKSAPLKLDRATLLNTFGETRAATSQSTSSRPQPFSRAPGAGAAFFGSGGTPDYLPSLPDGDMTVLNAKASKYATFVRRVAVQVFAALRTQGWENLSGGEINSAGNSTFAKASLDKKGNLISVQIITRSGSSSFDSVVESSIKTGARDPNPPIEAALEDGTYRFIFEARSWAVRANDPRTGAPSERRWLMLGTGLE